jgi:hypothetical protein
MKRDSKKVRLSISKVDLKIQLLEIICRLEEYDSAYSENMSEKLKLLKEKRKELEIMMDEFFENIED